MARSSSCSQAWREAFSGQEDHADAIFAGWRQLNTLLGHFGAIELVGNLDQQTSTVTHQRVGTDGATVVNVFEDLQTLLNNAVRLLALMCATKPTPQASCSALTYMPCSAAA